MADRNRPIADIVPGRPRDDPSFRNRVWELVTRIPPGRVMSYGQIARVLGAGYDARAIGNVMFATPKMEEEGCQIPWHRVINAQGGCSTAGRTMPPDLQQRLLESEGIGFNSRGRCEIDRYLWYPQEYLAENEAESGNQDSLFD
ncbi:MAG: MGMT family protein [Blastocatellia bacterium]